MALRQFGRCQKKKYWTWYPALNNCLSPKGSTQTWSLGCSLTLLFLLRQQQRWKMVESALNQCWKMVGKWLKNGWKKTILQPFSMIYNDSCVTQTTQHKQLRPDLDLPTVFIHIFTNALVQTTCLTSPIQIFIFTAQLCRTSWIGWMNIFVIWVSLSSITFNI